MLTERLQRDFMLYLLGTVKLLVESFIPRQSC